MLGDVYVCVHAQVQCQHFFAGKELLVLMTNGKLTVCRNLSPLEFQLGMYNCMTLHAYVMVGGKSLSALQKNRGNEDSISEVCTYVHTP